MEKKKCLVIQTFMGRYLAEEVFEASEGKEISLEVKLIQEPTKKVPRGYDIYFIHLNDILDEEDLVKLTKEQPKSYFVKIGIGGGYFIGEERIFDNSKYLFDCREIEEILKESMIKNNQQI